MKHHCIAVIAKIVVLCMVAPFTFAQTSQSLSILPVVKSAEMPLYPELARQAQIEGTARLQVWTDGSSIVKVQGTGAHKLLVDAAEANLRTWRFYPHKSQFFTVTFAYRLDRDEVFGLTNPSIVLHLPTRVEISTMRSRPETAGH